jgi:hypothetical protein
MYIIIFNGSRTDIHFFKMSFSAMSVGDVVQILLTFTAQNFMP